MKTFILVASPANFVIIDIISCRVLEVLRPFEKKQKQLLEDTMLLSNISCSIRKGCYMLSACVLQ